MTPPAPPALTAAEMVARLDEAAAAVACAVMMLNDGSRQSALDEMGKVQTKLDAVLAALTEPPPDAGLVALEENSPADRLIVRLLDKLTHWSDGDETDRAVVAKFEAERWKLLGVPLPARPTETPT